MNHRVDVHIKVPVEQSRLELTHSALHLYGCNKSTAA